MLVFQQEPIHDKIIYVTDPGRDNIPQDINVPLGPSPSGYAYSWLLRAPWSLAQISPIDRCMGYSVAESADMKYLIDFIDVFRYAWRTGPSLPLPKENIPCIGGLVFVPIRDLSYSDAMREIKAYIKKVGNRKVYISELAEELQIDMDLIKDILSDIQNPS